MKIVDSPESWNIWEDPNKINSDDYSGLPIVPRLPKKYPSYPNGPIAKCGECGRFIYQIEMYSCRNQRCPVQPQVWC